MMSTQLFVDTMPIRAEQYRANMTTILGRRVETVHGVTSFEPHAKNCAIRPGQYAVEVADKGGWPIVAVMDEAKFRRRYRFVGEAAS